jgi:phage major head subunit gpT-like protein
MKKVDNGGEITHGTLGDDTYSYSVDTYGRMIGLTRQDMINDDLGAFMQLPQMFGRGAALAVEQAFWTLVIANTGSFFAAGNGNYIDGATTNLSITGLTLGEQKLEEQTDSDGNPVLVRGRYLVIPPALTGIAQQLFTSTAIIAGTATAAQGNANIHAGKYEPLSTPYLKAAAKAWYLFGDPMDVAAFGIAWLNGVETPTVEEVAVSGEYLGRAWRGYIDFGVCQLDKRGAVKSKGEA